MKSIVNYRSNPWTIFNDDIFKLWNDMSYPSYEKRYPSAREFPKCSVKETEQYFVLSFDLPGVKKNDLNLEVKNNVLTVSGERKSEHDQEGYSERFSGSFERSFTLPEQMNPDAIEAQYEDGVLTVVLPKAEVKASKKIEISSGGSSKGFFSKLLEQNSKNSAA
jgi:HSP20 family protein